MRTRYQHGSLQLDKRSNGPDVSVYRWREYLQEGKMQRRGEIIGTIEEYPTKADAQKASEHLHLTANSDNPGARDLTFGALLDRYRREEMPERHSTNLAYRWYIETHIRPRWGDTPLRKVVAMGATFAVEQWLKALDLAPKTKGKHPQRDGRSAELRHAVGTDRTRHQSALPGQRSRHQSQAD